MKSKNTVVAKPAVPSDLPKNLTNLKNICGKTIKNTDTGKLMGMILSVLLVTIYILFLSDKGLFIAEEWYGYYAKCINDGQIVYKDFDFLFTPVYMYLIYAVVTLFGGSILAMRLFGVVVAALITLILYLVFCEFSKWQYACMAAAVSFFYLQSEVYTVFYDYIRVFDIFSYLAVLFMIRSIKKWLAGIEKWHGDMMGLGVCVSLMFLIKQNMGVVSGVFFFLCILLFPLIRNDGIKELARRILCFIISFMVPVVITTLLCLCKGILASMIQCVFFNAIGAKGGLATILFGWIIRGKKDFLLSLPCGLAFCVFLGILECTLENSSEKRIPDNPGISRVMDFITKHRMTLYVILFTVLGVIGLTLMFRHQRAASYASLLSRPDVTHLFLIAICFAVWSIVRIIRKKYTERLLSETVTVGAFLALCYGAGMSGGLSVGEAALGCGLFFLLPLNRMKISKLEVARLFSFTLMLCSLFYCVAIKLITPAYWWGIDESNIYEMTEETDIATMHGIKVSPSEKAMYEGVVHTICDDSDKNDKIYCFPMIPVIYLLADRMDPGVYEKVQWYDVSSSERLAHDYTYLQKHLPKVIVIYNVSDATYLQSEAGFYKGQKCGMREMRDHLYELVNTDTYVYKGTFQSTSNNISVYVLKQDKDIDKLFEGNGTEMLPYQIRTADDLVNLSMCVNQGMDLSGKYFCQTADIDLNNLIYVPAGALNATSFDGYFDSNGYSIYNINNSSINSTVPFGQAVGNLLK